MISYLNKDRPPPPRWAKVKARVPVGFLAPFYTLSWLADWALYLLGKWPVVALLQYLGSFPIIFAAAIYFSGAPGRVKQKHYQAWQVINMEEGKGGNGGRIDALEELNRDRISLIGINVAGAICEDCSCERPRRAAPVLRQLICATQIFKTQGFLMWIFTMPI